MPDAPGPDPGLLAAVADAVHRAECPANGPCDCAERFGEAAGDAEQAAARLALAAAGRGLAERLADLALSHRADIQGWRAQQAHTEADRAAVRANAFAAAAALVLAACGLPPEGAAETPESICCSTFALWGYHLGQCPHAEPPVSHAGAGGGEGG